ncbi:hypothetical protein [Salipaludibacillus daqingensis]|uniref:hypothetical protein n=1 Tax=Salipaludibacillus daqingensis TaxID=3041001 RepID=UPI0024757AD9|nr:hypothetical protein [Salipaludibacillus daqingensis]
MKYYMEVWDHVTNNQKRVLVDNGEIRFCPNSVEERNIYEMDTSAFNVYSGKVKLDRDVGFAFQNGHGMSYVKRMLLYGFSSFIYVVDIDYESLTERLIEEARQHFKTCPIDYILAVRVPLERLTQSWIRKLKVLSIPLTFFYVHSEEELIHAPWQRYLEAAFPVRMMFLIDQYHVDLHEKEQQSILQGWERIVKHWRVNSYFRIPKPLEKAPLLFLKRLGLYPQKGSFDSGSDADYFMYLDKVEGDTPIVLPDIIVLRGNIVKHGTTWLIEGEKGRELTSIVPEQFLPINAVYQYD